MISDRLCIATGGRIKKNMSTEDLLSCCKNCGGCYGGSSYKAIDYFEKQGVVTGGLYGDKTTCMPYKEINQMK